MGTKHELHVEVFRDGRWRRVPPPVSRTTPLSNRWETKHSPDACQLFCNPEDAGNLILPLRGLPEDLSYEVSNVVAALVDEAILGHQWYLLAELLAFDWEQSVLESTYRQLAESFFRFDLPVLRHLGDDPDKIRLVFWCAPSIEG